jgi:hypothetical protein
MRFAFCLLGSLEGMAPGPSAAPCVFLVHVNQDLARESIKEMERARGGDGSTNHVSWGPRSRGIVRRCRCLTSDSRGSDIGIGIGIARLNWPSYEPKCDPSDNCGGCFASWGTGWKRGN